jgi:DNA-binding NarL/FixJ family response regulator
MTSTGRPAIVVLTMENDPRFAREALSAGALAFGREDAADALDASAGQ